MIDPMDERAHPILSNITIPTGTTFHAEVLRAIAIIGRDATTFQLRAWIRDNAPTETLKRKADTRYFYTVLHKIRQKNNR